MANLPSWTEVTVRSRGGKFRRTLARIVTFEVNGEKRWSIDTKGGLTIGTWHKSEKEARDAFKYLVDLGIPEAKKIHADSLKTQAATGVNDDLYHSIIRRQIYLERYKAGVVKATKPILSKAMAAMIAKIDKLPKGATRARYERVLAEIQRLSQDMSSKLYVKLKADMKQLAENERSFVQSTMQTTIPTEAAIKIGLPTLNTLNKLTTAEPFQGLVLEQWTKSVGAQIAVKARQQLYIGLAEGDSVQKIVSRMRFIEEQSTRNLEMVVRTSVNHVTNQVKSTVYKENEDVLKGVMWRATLDSRTSDICAARDGEVYPVDDHPTPPAHPNCRSVIVPIVKSYRDLGLDVDDLDPGTRASMNGQVPADETYGSWLAKQDREFVYDVLGPTKGKMFLDGGLTLDKFIDSKGKSLTIEELQKLI